MIFQNFGFNRQIVAPSGGGGGLVSGYKVYFDIGNASSYPGSGTTVTNLGSAGSASNGTISASGLYSSANGGVLNLTHTNRDRITFTTSLTAAFTTMAIARKTSGSTSSWGTAASYYQGMPNIRGNNGFILTGNIDGNTQTLVIIWGGSSAQVPSANFVYPTDVTAFHSYAYTSNGSNEHKMYLDTAAPATFTGTISRSDSASLTSYINYDQPNNGSEDLTFMAYLQYDRVLSSTEIAQNYAVFSSRF